MKGLSLNSLWAHVESLWLLCPPLRSTNLQKDLNTANAFTDNDVSPVYAITVGILMHVSHPKIWHKLYLQTYQILCTLYCTVVVLRNVWQTWGCFVCEVKQWINEENSCCSLSSFLLSRWSFFWRLWQFWLLGLAECFHFIRFPNSCFACEHTQTHVCTQFYLISWLFTWLHTLLDCSFSKVMILAFS